jgi:hypothetical protein
VLVFMQLVIFMFFYVLGRFGFKWTYKGSWNSRDKMLLNGFSDLLSKSGQIDGQKMAQHS